MNNCPIILKFSLSVFILLFFSSVGMAIECQKCHQEFPKKYNFCPYDGNILWQNCSKCKKKVDSTWDFCPYDGQKLEDNLTLNRRKYKIGKKNITKNKNSFSKTSPKKVVELPAVDLVKQFMVSVGEDDQKTAVRLVAWGEYYKNYIRKIRKNADYLSFLSPAELSKQEAKFKEKMLSRIFSKENVKFLRSLKFKHYLLKMDEHKNIQVIVHSKVGNKSLKNIFTLKKVLNQFRITFIEN